ncbi:MAG: hypothetical protein OXQ89_00080 [Rhodospirillaceae bacterium]|nr:hypothetical protein [Rhodospirillaceae bacterium]
MSGEIAGATVCHDAYLGLLPRDLAKNGARIWINPRNAFAVALT